MEFNERYTLVKGKYYCAYNSRKEEIDRLGNTLEIQKLCPPCLDLVDVETGETIVTLSYIGDRSYSDILKSEYAEYSQDTEDYIATRGDILFDDHYLKTVDHLKLRESEDVNEYLVRIQEMYNCLDFMREVLRSETSYTYNDVGVVA